MSTPSRKQSHVNVVLNTDVGFRMKSNGLDDVELPYNALPEINFDEVDTSTTFLNKPLNLPLMISGMTGGYPDAEKINFQLAEACAETGIAFGVGSMRAAIEKPETRESYSVVKQFSQQIPIIANIGAVQLTEWKTENGKQNVAHGTWHMALSDLCDLIGASALAIHLNPLQELMQPEGEPRFRGVLDAIAMLVAEFHLPVIVKEVGAGISGDVAARLAAVGVKTIDVAGAGGTSWAGVEIMRRDDQRETEQYWDVGIPTAECIVQGARCKVQGASGIETLIASGGISSGTHVTHAIALGANLCGIARPALHAVIEGGTKAVVELINSVGLDLRRRMFLAGAKDLNSLGRILHP